MFWKYICVVICYLRLLHQIVLFIENVLQVRILKNIFFTSDFQTHYYYVSKLPTTYFYLTSIHACQTLPTRFSTKFQNALADKKKEVIQLTFTALNSQVETYHAVTKLFQFCLIRNTFFFIF